MNIEARNPDQGQNARQLAAAPEPVFIFDGRLPVLVWANHAALAFLGSAGTGGVNAPGSLPHLDRAMPALVRLRALAAESLPDSGRRLGLVFWTSTGARSLVCDCRRASFAFAPEAIIVHAAAPSDVSATLPKGDSKPLTGTPARPKRRAKKARSKAKRTISRKAAALPPTAAPSIAPPLAIYVAPAAALANTSPEVSATMPVALPVPAAVTSATAPPPPIATQSPPSVQSPPAPKHDASSDSFALREIARQIQSATSAHLARRAQANEAASQMAAAKPRRPIATQPDMLSQIGHEIRTPLSSILGFAEIMRDERLGAVGNPRYKSYAADIHDSATHALSLINDLLDLARLEAGGWRFEPVELDVAASIAGAVASLRPQAEKAGVMLSAPAGRPLPKLVCDARALKQMLLNLLSNAIKHTDSGGAVWATAASDDTGGLVIRVQDTGVGLSREDLAAVLEPWSQAGAMERRAGGSGLGLPLTKTMVEANGGKLVLERISGGGLAALLIFPAEATVRA